MVSDPDTAAHDRQTALGRAVLDQHIADCDVAVSAHLAGRQRALALLTEALTPDQRAMLAIIKQDPAGRFIFTYEKKEYALTLMREGGTTSIWRVMAWRGSSFLPWGKDVWSSELWATILRMLHARGSSRGG